MRIYVYAHIFYFNRCGKIPSKKKTLTFSSAANNDSSHVPSSYFPASNKYCYSLTFGSLKGIK